MIGIILSGGQSSRMGQDKGLIMQHGKNWAQIAREKISQLAIPAVLSISDQQRAQYELHFDPKDLVVDNPTLTIQGPLRGLMSAHLIYPNQDIFVVACDLVSLDIAVIRQLLSTFKDSRAEAVAFKGERVEPLCAIYSSRGLGKIFSAYENNSLERHSMMHVLDTLDTTYIPVEWEWVSSFKNYNSPDEMT